MPMNDIKVIFEDENICVIDKPYGVVVNNAQSVKSETVRLGLQQNTIYLLVNQNSYKKGSGTPTRQRY